jgi:hypothetical protein
MSDDVITFERAEQHPRYKDLKVFVDSPYEARDIINGDEKGLDFDEFHQSWSSNIDWAEDGYWLIDADKIHLAAKHFKEHGWDIESELPIEIYVPEDFELNE